MTNLTATKQHRRRYLAWLSDRQPTEIHAQTDSLTEPQKIDNEAAKARHDYETELGQEMLRRYYMLL